MRTYTLPLALGIAAFAAPAQVTVDVTKTSKYAGTPRFVEICGLLKKSVPVALRTIRTRIGVGLDRKHGVRLELRDAAPKNPDRIRVFGGLPFLTRGSNPVLVRLHAEFLLRGSYDLREEVTHELTHAVMRARMNPASYRKVPRWLREGLALWVAGQGETRVRSILRLIDSRKLSVLVPGLDQGKHDFLRYAEDYLAIEFLVKKKGKSAPKKIVQGLLTGRPAVQVVSRVAGLEWQKFVSAARAYAQGRVAALRADGWSDYLQVWESNRKRRYQDVIQAARTFLAARPNSALRWDVSYLLGKALRLTKKPQEAIAALKSTARTGTSPFADEARYQIGAAQLAGGEHQAAAKTFAHLLRDYPEITILDRVVWRLIDCHVRQGNKPEARRLVQVFEKSFPDSRVADRVSALGKQLRGSH